MATREEMQEASDEAIEQLQEMMKQDEQFAIAMRKFGKWLQSWYIPAGYKQICRWLRQLK
jgi:2'-5' RNA ligase